ncbi:KAR9 [Candida pseudojiufengensis]|uniref:KAR9 n=1 Tax=Candida pseudojiufengensis TaxID=497109 RepID=UPI0022259DCC|nr:KAR9 [Candida pseudojiufengensis]KAI5962264.1 KAR9 [Candida pseudojiufengensis]
MNQLNCRNPQINLSHLLTSISNFSFFEELVNLSESSQYNSIKLNLSQHETFKINKILDDIDLYLNDVIMAFNNIKEVSKHTINLLEWYYEGKNVLVDLFRNLESIDSIVSRLLLLVESSEADNVVIQSLIKKFEEVSDILLDVKKLSISLKKNLDLSINYNDLIESVIRSLRNEIEDCIKSIEKLKDYNLSSPRKTLPKYNLNDIITKMKINDFNDNSSNSIKSLKLPTFNDLDEKIYEEYLMIEAKIQPLKISLDIVPQKVEEFIALCSHNSSFQVSREQVLSNYEALLDKWKLLSNQSLKLKIEKIDSKWNDIFRYLVKQIESESDDLIDVLTFCDSANTDGNSVVSDDIGSRYKICLNSIRLIESAIMENIITDSDIRNLYNRTLQPKWVEVNDLISRSKSEQNISFLQKQRKESNNKKSHSKGLRSFHTISRSSGHENSDRPLSNGLGIDFNVDVKSVTLPLSIQNKEKVKDIFLGKPKPTGRSLKNSLINVFDELSIDVKDTEDEEKTLVKSPDLKIENPNDHKLQAPISFRKATCSRSVSFDFNGYFNNILNSSIRQPSKLPRMKSNYLAKGYPKIIKRNGHTRIPEICSNHPIFQSPCKLRLSKFSTPRTNNLDISPEKQFRASSTIESHHHRNDPFLLSKTRSRASSSTTTVIGRPNSLLNEMKIPNLTFSRRLSYNCTSPERPVSSLGSRFDDENLLKSLDENRPAWR